MNKKRLISIIVIVVGFISIIGGGIFALTSKDSKPTPKDKDKNVESVKPNKSFKTIVELEHEEFREISKDNFEISAKQIGFREIECNNDFCVARKETYEIYSSADTMSISYSGNSIYSVGTYTYYHEKDYIVEDIVKNLNSLIQNYIGYSYTTEYFEGLNEKLKENIENDNSEDNFIIDRVYIGEYTLETIISYAENFYIIKTFFINTADYM